MPHVAVVVIVYAATGILISHAPIAWAGGGLAAGLLAALVQGMAQAAHDGRHPH